MNCPHCQHPINIGKLLRSVASEARSKASAANGRKNTGKSLADRSRYVADKEAQGLAERVGSEEPTVSTRDSFVELDEQQEMPDYENN